MVHRKSIPLQSLLYFNNFLEFSYFYSLRNFQLVFRNLDYLKIFLRNFFSEILGFSINRLRIDFCFDSVELFIDFLIVSYKIRTGLILRKCFKKKFNRNFFFVYFCNGASFLNTKIDVFLYKMFLLYRRQGFKFFRQSLQHVNVFLKTGGFRGSSLSLCPYNSCVVTASYSLLLLLVKSIFVYYFAKFSFNLQNIYIFYCFIILSFSVIFNCFVRFPCSHFSKNLKVYSKISNVAKVVIFDNKILNVLDFVYFYTIYSKFFVKRLFLFRYFSRFFNFFFNKFLFFKKLQFFVWRILNFFQYILFFWYLLKFTVHIICLPNFVLSKFVYVHYFAKFFNIYVKTLKVVSVIIKRLLPVNSLSSAINLRIIHLLRFGYFCNRFHKYLVKNSFFFNFFNFFIKIFDMHFYFLGLLRSSLLIMKHKSGNSAFITSKSLKKVYIDRVSSGFQSESVISLYQSSVLKEFTPFKLNTGFGLFRLVRLHKLFRQLRNQCLYYRRHNRYRFNKHNYVSTNYFMHNRPEVFNRRIFRKRMYIKELIRDDIRACHHRYMRNLFKKYKKKSREVNTFLNKRMDTYVRRLMRNREFLRKIIQKHKRTHRVNYNPKSKRNRKFIGIGTQFHRFFNLNCASWGLKWRFTSVPFWGGKPFIYFFLYFVYQLDFVYKILKDCAFINFFIFYLIFFFKNWNFLNFWFYKFFKKSNILESWRVVRLDLNVFAYRAYFESFFYRKFSLRFQGFIIRKNSKFFNYFYKCYTKKLFIYFKQRFSKNFFFGYIFKYVMCRALRINSFLRCFSFLNYFIVLGKSLAFANFFKYLKKMVICFYSNRPVVLNLNIGLKLFNLIEFNYSVFNSLQNENISSYLFYNILMYKWNFQLKCNFMDFFIRSFLFVFNLKYFKSLCVLYCFIFLGFDFFFKFYLNLHFVNFIFFCEFFHFIFKVNFLFKFFFLKMHFTDYRFGGFLGLYLLFFKFSRLSVSVCGSFVLDYIYDIFFYLFITNRYTSIRYYLSILAQLFNDFLQIDCFCGFNFKIKGRLSKRTQRKQCFVVRNGVLSWTDMAHNLYVGKRILTTHIGSVSIQLAVQLKR